MKLKIPLLLLTLSAQIYPMKRSSSTNDLCALMVSRNHVEQIHSVMAKIDIPKDKLIVNTTIVFREIAYELQKLSTLYKDQSLFFMDFSQAIKKLPNIDIYRVLQIQYACNYAPHELKNIYWLCQNYLFTINSELD